MDKEQQIKELQGKIESLANNVRSFQHELYLLQC
jgi:hypothetical protein